MKRKLSIVLVICMLLSVLPFAGISAGAAEAYAFVDASTAGGRVEANGAAVTADTKFEAGTVVAVTFTADNGYVLKTYSIVDGNGTAITLDNGKLTMPEAGVTVTANFVKADSGVDYDQRSSELTLTEQFLEFLRGIFQSFFIVFIPFKDIKK